MSRSLTLAGLALAGTGGVLLVQPPRAQPAVRAPQPVVKAVSKSAWFVDVAAESGIDFRFVSGHRERFYMPELMAGGVGFLDFDKDGDLDLYFVQGGRVVGPRDGLPGNKLYENDGRGRFRDVTQTAGVGDVGYGMGCTCADYDGDGWTDIYITNAGPNALYRNNADGTFTNVTEQAGVGDPGFGSSAAFVDYDHDADLDLMVVNYVRWSPETEPLCRARNGQIDYCGPNDYGAPGADVLYRNEGDGTFTDVTEAAGLSTAFGNGLGVVCGDFNGDGLTDICVANDQTANQLWINQGDGTFRDEALERGVAYNGDGKVEAGMGIDAQDIDADGDLDLYMTHFEDETNTLYINEGRFFLDQTVRFGLGSTAPFTGFGTAMIDLNNDGLLDIFVVNGRAEIGHAPYQQVDPYVEPNQLFEGVDLNRLREVSPQGGTASRLIHASRGAAFGDYDNDGRIDVAVVNKDGPAYLLNNRTPKRQHWITFSVIDARGDPSLHNRDAIGARVTIQFDGKRRIRDVRSAYSYCASNDPRVHFGLGDASRVDSVTVTWTDGVIQASGPYRADQFVTLRRW